MLKYIRNVLVVAFLSIFSSLSFASQVDINSADAATLAQSINGIGPSKAQAIVEYREANGPFASLDDLVLVQGIGAKTLDRIRESITLSPTASSAVSSAGESPAVSLEQPALQAN